MDEKNIYQRLSLITEEAGQIPKRGKNTFSNYNYVLAVDVIGHIRKLLIKHGVHVSISETENLKRYRDGKNFHCETTSTAKFINIDNPTDIHEVRYHAVAADTLDKDIYKAKTGGLKYLFSQEFKIITNDFIDVETSDDKPAMANDQQLVDITTLQKKIKIPDNEFTKRLKKKFGISATKELTEDQAEELIKSLGAIANA